MFSQLSYTYSSGPTEPNKGVYTYCIAIAYYASFKIELGAIGVLIGV